MTALAESIPSDLQLGDQIGKGSYGSVYTAQYGQRQVAVKAVPLENSAEGDALDRELQTEIKMLKKCDSEWVVRYFGCLAKGRTLWICMEFCDGGSVSDVRSSTRCTLDDSLSPLPAQPGPDELTSLHPTTGVGRCCGAPARHCSRTRSRWCATRRRRAR